MSKYIENNLQFKNNQNSNKSFSQKSTEKDKKRSISTTSCSSSTPTTSPCSTCSSASSCSLSSANVSSDKRKIKSTIKDNTTQGCPYFIPIINHNPISVSSSVEPYPEPFKQIQLTPCDELSTHDTNTLDISSGHFVDGQVLLSKTTHAEVHSEPSSSKSLKKSSKTKSSSSSSTAPSSLTIESVAPSRPIVVDSLPNFSPLNKNTYNLNSKNKGESKMTIYSILSKSNQDQPKPDKTMMNGSLPNGLTRNPFPLLEKNQQSRGTKKLQTDLSEIRLNMETIKETDQLTIKDNQLKDEIINENIDKCKLNTDANENNINTSNSTKVNCSSNSVINDDDKKINHDNQSDGIKNLLKKVSSDKKIALERRLSGSSPCPDTPESNESSVPSPGWATKILNPESRSQNMNTQRPKLNNSQRYSSVSSSRAPSMISGYSVYDVQIPHEKLTDLRKILHPEVEKRDLETVFKAHWETFMDCRCFECTFNNAAKIITVVVLAITFSRHQSLDQHLTKMIKVIYSQIKLSWLFLQNELELFENDLVRP
ncbi:putative uncharacterized protein DDB_G0277255 [Panonychus citri]|uniref:putative uncharacterized protein DDB_G0277255 n=1 Tax=Panonychus citri TaxID=50023 RepID=UPI00230782DE|nr:putative uncharacterized protein DDB_G0277255 [Panonychus citri]XP_053207078.1 putative uncharacterized protein DDB_G0277255 [Panonychus citri]